jgi:hypothetical protein
MKSQLIIASLTLILLSSCSHRDDQQSSREIVIQTNNLAQVRDILARSTVQKIEWREMNVTNTLNSMMSQMFEKDSSVMFSISMYWPNPSQTITITATNINYRDLLDEICQQSDTFWSITEYGMMTTNLHNTNTDDVIAAGIVVVGKEWFDEYKKTHK